MHNLLAKRYIDSFGWKRSSLHYFNGLLGWFLGTPRHGIFGFSFRAHIESSIDEPPPCIIEIDIERDESVFHPEMQYFLIFEMK